MQKGQIVKITGRWYVRFRERRNVNGTLKVQRISHCLGAITTRGKHPPADIRDAADVYMASLNRSAIPSERVVTIGDFVERVYLPWIRERKRPSTARSYANVWAIHLKPLCAEAWLKNTRTYDVQGWLSSVNPKLSRSTHKHVKNLLSSIFKLAKGQGFFDGVNPVTDSAINPQATEAAETHAYTLAEIDSILAVLPELAATAFAVAAYSGLRVGEIEGLDWSDYQDAEIQVSRSVWNGHTSDPKTRKSRAAVPAIRQLAARLEMHRLRCGNPDSGPMFQTTKGTRLSMHNVRERDILPALHKAGIEWHGWHACRRGLGSNLYRLGVPDVVIQRILRHANVSTTLSCYVKTISDDVRDAMTKLENNIQQAQLDTAWTPIPRPTTLN